MKRNPRYVYVKVRASVWFCMSGPENDQYLLSLLVTLKQRDHSRVCYANYTSFNKHEIKLYICFSIEFITTKGP